MLVKNWGEIGDQFFKKGYNLTKLFIKQKSLKVLITLTVNTIQYQTAKTNIRPHNPKVNTQKLQNSTNISKKCGIL